MADAGPSLSAPSLSGSAARARLYAAAETRSRGRADALRGGAPRFTTLCAPPAWFVADATEQERLGHLAALLSVAPALKACLSGRVLGPLADLVGDDALEAVLEAETGEDAADIDPAPDALRAFGPRLIARARAGEAQASRLLNLAAALPLPTQTPATAPEEAAA